MRKYKPLVVVILREAGTAFRVMLRSFDRNVGANDADLVVIGPLPADARGAVEQAGGTVVKSDKPADPHLWVADYLNRAVVRNQPDRPVVVLEAGHTLFQTDELFRCVPPDAVSLLAEPWVVAHDVWNREGFEDLTSTLRPQFVAESFADVQIVSAAVAAGPARLVAQWEFLRVAVDVRNAKGAGQASVTALAHWARGWPGYNLVPVTDPWVAHGHWASVVGIPFEDGVALNRRTGEPYAILHDWHRVDVARKAIERKYL